MTRIRCSYDDLDVYNGVTDLVFFCRFDPVVSLPIRGDFVPAIAAAPPMSKTAGLLAGSSGSTYPSMTSQQECHCHLVRTILQPGDTFKCSLCGDDGTSDRDADGDHDEEPPPSTQPPPRSNSQNTNRRVQEIFQRISGGSKSRSQSAAVARSEALSTFSAGGKAAQYQKLARGPTPALGKV